MIAGTSVNGGLRVKDVYFEASGNHVSQTD